MAEDASWLDFNRCDFRDSLNVETMIGELVPYLVVVCDDDDLDNDLGRDLLMRKRRVKVHLLTSGFF